MSANPSPVSSIAQAREKLVRDLVDLIFSGLRDKRWLYWPPGPMTGQVFDKEVCARDVGRLKAIDDLLAAAPQSKDWTPPNPARVDDSINLTQCTDAKVWAEQFVARFGGDEGLMLSYFANAIMAGWDEATRRAAAAPQWQPIETAPKDGTEILLWIGRGIEPRARIGYWRERGEAIGWTGVQSQHTYGGDLVTHWQPLPAAPPETGADQ